MADEKKYVNAAGKVRTASKISIVLNNKRYSGITDSLALSLGYDNAEAMLLDNGWSVYVPAEVALTLEDVIIKKIAEIEAYGGSSEVNVIKINGETTWYGPTERASMRNLFEAQKADAQASTTMWVNGTAHSLVPIDEAISVLNKIEIYAGECYNTTQAHIVDVKASNTISEAEAFDVKTGYPSIPNIVIA